MGWFGNYGYKPYVRVAQRRANAAREMARRMKNGQTVCPVRVEGRLIAKTFWGKSWCVNLESYSDFANRLPRGRTYARNGSIAHLAIEKGRIEAVVSGSELYDIRIEIAALSKKDWDALKEQSAGKVGTLVELLQGKLSSSVMELVTDRDQGLFPKPKEIKMHCSCPDGAYMCKHLAAVLYGVGNRLDSSPELLFVLRGVDHSELIEQAIPKAKSKARTAAPTLAADDLGAIFDIEIDAGPAAPKGVDKVPEKPATRASNMNPAEPVTKARVKTPAKAAAKKSPAAKKTTAASGAKKR